MSDKVQKIELRVLIIILIVIIVLILLIWQLAKKNPTPDVVTPPAPAGNGNEGDSAIAGANAEADAGSQGLNPVNNTTPTIVPTPGTAAAPIELPFAGQQSPFDGSIFLANQNSSNALATNTANGLAQKIHGYITNSFITMLPSGAVEAAISKQSWVTNQLQISQIASVYKSIYGTDVLTDVNNAFGQEVGNYVVTMAAGLPKGY